MAIKMADIFHPQNMTHRKFQSPLFVFTSLFENPKRQCFSSDPFPSTIFKAIQYTQCSGKYIVIATYHFKLIVNEKLILESNEWRFCAF